MSFLSRRGWVGWVLGAVAVTFIILVFSPSAPVYRTEAKLLFDPRKVGGKSPDAEGAMAQFKQQLEDLRGPPFFNYLTSSFSPGETNSILTSINRRRDTSDPKTLEAILRENVQISPAGAQPSVISVIATHPVPELAALIANRYATKYVDFVMDREYAGGFGATVYVRSSAEIGGKAMPPQPALYAPIKLLERAKLPTSRSK